MKFYKIRKNKYESASNSHSRFLEIHQGYDKFPMFEITRVDSFGFGWDTNRKDYYKKIMTNKEFRGWLIDRREEYEFMLKRTNKLILQLQKGEF